jgi:hypothetical protein
MSDDRPGVYESDGTIYYRASELGHCVRRLWAWRSGLERRPFPEKIQAAMDVGSDLEQTILNDLFDNYNFTFADGGFQKEVILKVTDNIVVIGHIDQEGCQYMPDATFVRDSANRSIDVKAFGQKLVSEYHTKGITALEHYAWQQSVYALALGHRTFYMPIYNKDTKEIEPWSLEPVIAPYDELDIYRRIKIVEQAYEKNEMPDCTNEYGCPFFYLHDTPKEKDSLPDPAIPFVRARIAITNKIRALQYALGLMNDKIIEQLPEGERYDYEGYTVKVMPNPDRFNTDAAKALLKDADVDWEHDPAFIIPGKGVQLRIDPPKKGPADGRQT